MGLEARWGDGGWKFCLGGSLPGTWDWELGGNYDFLTCNLMFTRITNMMWVKPNKGLKLCNSFCNSFFVTSLCTPSFALQPSDNAPIHLLTWLMPSFWNASSVVLKIAFRSPNLKSIVLCHNRISSSLLVVRKNIFTCQCK